MASFTENARVFEWTKGTKDKDGNKQTKSKWIEKYYGKVTLEKLNIKSVDNEEVLNHKLQSAMVLKPAFNCTRSWIYRLKTSDDNEITYALRFKKPQLAQDFQESFTNIVNQLKKEEEDAAAAKAAQTQVIEAAPAEKTTENNEP